MEKKEKQLLIIKTIIAFLFPFFLCLVFCAIKRTSFFDIYIPAAKKNDCLFYYKVVEGMIKYGMPKGFFGYNESHALIGTLPTWSPVTYLPWFLWGKIFGWNNISAILCNVFFFSASFSFFVFIIRPNWKNIISFFVFCFLFTCIPFYLMNLQPEILIVSCLIVFFSFSYKMGKTKKDYIYIFLMLLITFFLSLARPYLILLIGLPAFWLIKKKTKFRYLIIIGTLVGSILGYYLLAHYFTSEYLVSSFDTELIRKILTLQISDAVNMIVQIIPFFFGDLKNALIVYGLRNTSVTQYIIVVLMVILSSFLIFDKKKKDNKTIYVYFVIVTIIMLVAIILFRHSSLEGGRYLFSFSVVGCLVIAFGEVSRMNYISRIVLVVLFLFLLTRGALSPMDIDVPKDTNNLKQTVDYWEKIFDEDKMINEQLCGYENTIDWVYNDYKQGEIIKSRYGELFAIPAGMGISCCTGDYVLENFSDLKSRYIATPSGGDIDTICSLTGWKEIGRTMDLVVYSKY